MATSRKSARRSALGADPLDMLTSATPARSAGQGSTRLAGSGSAEAAAGDRATKERMTVQLPAELLGEVRDAVVHLSGPPARLTLAGFVEAAMRAELERLRGEHAKGKRFPRHDAPLRAGRPLGS